jgi:hypothetical protein
MLKEKKKLENDVNIKKKSESIVNLNDSFSNHDNNLASSTSNEFNNDNNNYNNEKNASFSSLETSQTDVVLQEISTNSPNKKRPHFQNDVTECSTQNKKQRQISDTDSNYEYNTHLSTINEQLDSPPSPTPSIVIKNNQNRESETQTHRITNPAVAPLLSQQIPIIFTNSSPQQTANFSPSIIYPTASNLLSLFTGQNLLQGLVSTSQPGANQYVFRQHQYQHPTLFQTHQPQFLPQQQQSPFNVPPNFNGTILYQPTIHIHVNASAPVNNQASAEKLRKITPKKTMSNQHSTNKK